MKICITAAGDNLDSPLDARFGRAMYFLIVDEKGEILKKIRNPGVQAIRGAGIAAAQAIVNEKVDVLISGNIGPNAFMVLGNSGIRIFAGPIGMSVKTALEEYQKGNLHELKAAPPSPGFGRGFGRGGFGRGPHRWRRRGR